MLPLPSILEKLQVPRARDGRAWHHRHRGERRLPHRHEELEINLCTRGQAVYLVDDRRFELKRGVQIWLFPEQDHLLIDQSSDNEMWIAIVRPQVLERLCTSPHSRALLQRKPQGEFCRQLAPAQAEQLEGLWQEAAECEDESLFNATLGFALLKSWACHSMAGQSVRGSDVHPAVERAARLLHERADAVNIEQLAREAGLSPAWLSRLFKEQIGVTLTEFRARQCLERFLRLYGKGRRRGMADAALEAGFGSYAQFHRVFRAQMGCSPADYRRQFGPQDERDNQ